MKDLNEKGGIKFDIYKSKTKCMELPFKFLRDKALLFKYHSFQFY